MSRRGVLSQRPIARILLVLGVVMILINLLAGSSILNGLGWAAILASAVVGAFFEG